MEHQLNLNSTYQPSDKVVPRKIRDKLLIVPIEDGVANFDDAMFSFNETGEDIWSCIEQKLSLDKIIETLTEDYAAPRDQIESGVVKLITTLLEKGIIIECQN